MSDQIKLGVLCVFVGYSSFAILGLWLRIIGRNLSNDARRGLQVFLVLFIAALCGLVYAAIVPISPGGF